MSFVHRLGGWQRLWVVLVLIYAVVVMVVAFMTAPSQKQIFSNWTEAILKSTGKDYSVIQFRASKDFQNKTDEQIAQEMTKRAKEIDLSKPDKQDLGEYQKQIATLGTVYGQQIEGLPIEQAKHAGWSFLVWLIPSLCMLFLGYAVSWVMSGFKAKDK
jgi:uncharacterized membrane protein YdfJ with MMPL/SSD domain